PGRIVRVDEQADHRELDDNTERRDRTRGVARLVHEELVALRSPDALRWRHGLASCQRRASVGCLPLHLLTLARSLGCRFFASRFVTTGVRPADRSHAESRPAAAGVVARAVLWSAPCELVCPC